METVLLSIRSTIISAFLSLPLILISFVGFLAVALGNMGLFMLFIGHILITPFVYASNYVLAKQNTLVHSRAGHLVPGSHADTIYDDVTPSFWTTQIFFFFGYLISNAVHLTMKQKTDSKLDPKYVAKRTSKAMSIIVFGTMLMIFLVGFRYTRGTETGVGMMLATLIGLGGAIGWYAFASTCNINIADIFGISQQMIPVKNSTPMTCVYAPKP